MNEPDPARDYHHLTEHRRGLARRADPRLVLGFRPMQWGRKPPQFKRYRGLPSIILPPDPPVIDVAAVDVLSGLAGADPAPLDLDGISRLLFHTAGVVRVLEVRSREAMFFRAAGSAGNLSPLELYLVVTGVHGLDEGLYHYEPVEHALTRLGPGPGGGGPTTVVITGVPWRTCWKYADRGFRHLYWDAGTMLAHLLALAESVALPVRVQLGFEDAQVTRLVGADGVHEFPLAVVLLGPGDPVLTPGPGPVPVGHLADDPLEFPLVTATQRAGDLTTAADVAAWRVHDGSRASSPVAPPPPGRDEPLEAVILRRGSTRRFDPRVVGPAPLLGWALSVATRPVPADFVAAGATLLEHDLAVHAVDGVEPGAYRWSDGKLELLRAGYARMAGRHLCLDQALGGDGAYTAFHCSDLETVLEHLGSRGYRAAQLEASIVEGRLHLAAFALGFGATGLTFFDEEVRRFFPTAASPMLVTAVGRPAYRSRRGGRPRRPTRMAG